MILYMGDKSNIYGEGPIHMVAEYESPSSIKEEIRRRIWDLMEKTNVASFPRPVYGRIPNFVGAEVAARRLSELEEFKRARVVKVNPDSPQKSVRYLTLQSGKILLIPTPRLRSGFLLLNPSKIPRSVYGEASTIHGAFKYGEACRLRDIPKVDLLVVGSVAVSRDGARVGKGGGYSELEYGILREVGAVDNSTPILTTVHDIQIVDFVLKEPHDLTVNAIITPTKVIRVNDVGERPRGIFWEKIPIERIREIPVLMELKAHSLRKDRTAAL
ncbi:MAG: 5-formyltetrahydrofolate cyclo-ligase [Candidatus Bathyarchaeia archaeon]